MYHTNIESRTVFSFLYPSISQLAHCKDGSMCCLTAVRRSEQPRRWPSSHTSSPSSSSGRLTSSPRWRISNMKRCVQLSSWLCKSILSFLVILVGWLPVISFGPPPLVRRCNERYYCRARLLGSRLGLPCKNPPLGSKSVPALSSCSMWTVCMINCLRYASYPLLRFRPLPGRGPGTQSPRCRTRTPAASSTPRPWP